jgi:hypothetical protein
MFPVRKFLLAAGNRQCLTDENDIGGGEFIGLGDARPRRRRIAER